MEQAVPAPRCAAFLIWWEIAFLEAAWRNKESQPHTRPLAQGPRAEERIPYGK